MKHIYIYIFAEAKDEAKCCLKWWSVVFLNKLNCTFVLEIMEFIMGESVYRLWSVEKRHFPQSLSLMYQIILQANNYKIAVVYHSYRLTFVTFVNTCATS